MRPHDRCGGPSLGWPEWWVLNLTQGVARHGGLYITAAKTPAELPHVT